MRRVSCSGAHRYSSWDSSEGVTWPGVISDVRDFEQRLLDIRKPRKSRIDGHTERGSAFKHDGDRDLKHI
jgi:hypothetical protein